jgi:hypothetical protein
MPSQATLQATNKFDKLLDGLKVTECPLSLRRFDLARLVELAKRKARR